MNPNLCENRIGLTKNPEIVDIRVNTGNYIKPNDVSSKSSSNLIVSFYADRQRNYAETY